MNCWKTSLLIVLWLPSVCSAQLTDDFSAARDYLDPGFDFTAPGVIWDGILAADGTVGTDPFNDGNVLQANTTATSGEFTIESTLTNWNRQGGDAGFLYIDNVVEDFIAEVDMTFVERLAFHEAGLSVRLNTDPFDRNATANVQSRIQGWGGAVGGVRYRSVIGTGQTDGSTTGALEEQTVRLRLQKDGTLFTVSYSLDGGTTFLSPGPNDSVDRPDFEGQPLQVGLFSAAYSPDSRTARFDNFSFGTFVPGDVNGDGLVTETDFSIIRDNMFEAGTRTQGDLNSDLFVDFDDFQVWKRFAPPEAIAAVLGVTVPEPVSCWLGLGFATAFGARILRRRQGTLA